MSSKGTWLKDPNILELFFNGRHHHISFILTSTCVNLKNDL